MTTIQPSTNGRSVPGQRKFRPGEWRIIDRANAMFPDTSRPADISRLAADLGMKPSSVSNVVSMARQAGRWPWPKKTVRGGQATGEEVETSPVPPPVSPPPDSPRPPRTPQHISAEAFRSLTHEMEATRAVVITVRSLPPASARRVLASVLACLDEHEAKGE